MNNNKICVFDFETDGTDVETLSPVQVAAVIIDPRKLEIIEGAEFNSYMRPEKIDEEDYIKKNLATIEWHAKVQNCKKEEVVDKWRAAPEIKHVWGSFLEFLSRYHASGKKKTRFSAPVACGANIIKFDLPISDKLCKKYAKGKNIFHPRDIIDIMHWFFPWFENSEEVSSYSMDNMRKYFGISSEGAHDALKDVQDVAEICIKFMRLHRRTASKVKFKGSFNK